MPATLVTGAIGAVVGGLAGGLISIARQLWFDKPPKTLKTLDWRAIGGAALQGVITGGLAGLTLGATAVIPSLATRIALASGGSIISGLLGLFAGSEVTGVAPTKGQIIATVVGSAVGGAFGGALVGPAAAPIFSSVPRIAAVGAVTGAATGAASQTSEEATNGFPKGAGKRILAATGMGGVVGAGVGAAGGAITKVLPAPVEAPPVRHVDAPPIVDPGDSTAIGVVGAINDLAVAETNPHPSSGTPGGSKATPSGGSTTPPKPSLDRPLGDEPPLTAEQILGPPPKPISTREFLSKAVPGFEQKTPAEQQELIDRWDHLASRDPTAPGDLNFLRDVAPLFKLSPSLAQAIQRAEELGWKVRYGTAGKGSFADWQSKTVVVDPVKANNPADLARTLAHELGHVLDGNEARPSAIWRPGMTRDEHISANTAATLRGEGMAVMANVGIEEEILANGGQRIGLNTANDALYRQIATDPSLTFDQKVNAIAQVFEQHEITSSMGQPYGQFWRTYFGGLYDAWAAAQPHP